MFTYPKFVNYENVGHRPRAAPQAYPGLAVAPQGGYGRMASSDPNAESEDVTPQCGCLVGSAIHFAARLKHRIWRGLQAHLSDHSSAKSNAELLRD